MIKADTRQQSLARLTSEPDWDVIVIGGGVVGAGVFKYANQLGLKALLLEQKDFAWGSSSRSSKMVHGGLRYIAEGQIRLTKESVQERELLIEKAQGLVASTSYVFSHHRNQFPGRFAFNTLMWLYSQFSGRKQYRSLSPNDYAMLMPGIKQDKLLGGTQYVDALTDDARLVFRLIQEARSHGAVALNYVKVSSLLRDSSGTVTGVTAVPEELEQGIELKAKLVINATGAWANKLDSQVIIRPLRGSHILVPNWRLPVASVLTLLHPKDRRPVMIYPWQNATLIGTTDLDHEQDLDIEPTMTREELDYIFEAVESQFPNTKLTDKDLLSSYAGVRPIVLDHPIDKSVSASHEKREHSLFAQPGFITVTGGKLTTFRIIAHHVMNEAASGLGLQKPLVPFALFENAQASHQKYYGDYLAGRFGRFVEAFVGEFAAQPKLMQPIRYSNTLWAELVYAVRYEQVQHLDDLMLRRTRLGNVLPQGGVAELPRIQALCAEHLPWSEQQWQQEIERYQQIWTQHYSLPQ